MQTWARVTGSDEGDSPTGSEVDFGTGVEQTATTVDHVDSEMVVMASGGNSSNRKDNKGEQVMRLFLADVTDTETADDNATAPSIVEVLLLLKLSETNQLEMQFLWNKITRNEMSTKPIFLIFNVLIVCI